MTGPHYVSPGLRAVMARREEMHEEVMDLTDPLELSGYVATQQSRDAKVSRQSKAYQRHLRITLEVTTLRNKGFTMHEAAKAMGLGLSTIEHSLAVINRGASLSKVKA